MTKFLFAILLILGIYIYATITPASRTDVTRTVVMIPHHISTAFQVISERGTQLQVDYDTEQGE
jgi:hypothetical protein